MIVRIIDADGAVGTGYSYTIGTGGHSVMELLKRMQPAAQQSVLGLGLMLGEGALQLSLATFIGFFFYYKGLALGGIAKMSQVQLLLPFLAIFAAHWIARGVPTNPD